MKIYGMSLVWAGSISLDSTCKEGLRIYLEPPLLLLQPVLHPTDGVLSSLTDEEACKIYLR
jgi:hypothetical protein